MVVKINGVGLEYSVMLETDCDLAWVFQILLPGFLTIAFKSTVSIISFF